jgi:hypothetical protein
MGGLRVLGTYRRPDRKAKEPEIQAARPTSYFAEKWGYSNSTIWRYTKLAEDPLPSYRVQGSLRIDVKKAAAWWERHSSEGGNQ